MIELFRSDNLLVRSVPAQDRSRWVVTFDNYGIGHGFDRAGFGQTFLQASGISAIHVMGVREDWYQYPEMFEALAVVREAMAGAERIMTYGSSMGGYAALRFADAVGANAVLALSPQYTIDPAKVAFERRWTQDAGRIKWRPEIEGTLAMGPAPVVVYDPQNEDGKHLQLIRNDIPVHAIKLPFSGHPVMTVLAEAKLLKRLVLETLAGQLDVEDFQAEALVARRSSPNHLSILAQAQLPQRPRLALAIAEKALSLNPNSALAKVGLARIQSKQGLYDAALDLMRPLAEAPKAEVLLHVQFAELLAEAGQYPEAILYAEKVLAKVPDMAHLIAWKAHFHWLNGEPHEAIAMVRHAQVLDRLNPHFAVSIKAYEESLEEDTPSTQKRRVTPIKRLLHGLGLVRHDSPDAA